MSDEIAGFIVKAKHALKVAGDLLSQGYPADLRE